MSYQGNKPATSFESPKKDRFTGISGTTCSLTYPVSSVADILVWVNGVKQDFTNYSVSGSTLTLGGTLVSADIVEVTYVGRTYGSIVPSDASVGINQLSATGTKSSSTFLRGDNTFASAGITGISSSADATAMTIDSGERVGINSSNMSSLDADANQLVVGSGSGDNGLTVYSDGSSSGSIFFANGTTGTQTKQGQIVYEQNNSAMIFKTGATERFRVTSDGIAIGGTGSANSLDDYEEGTFTPTWDAQSGTVNSVASNYGYYTKIGNLCTVFVGGVLTTTNAGTNYKVTNLPFQANTTSGDSIGSGFEYGHTGTMQLVWVNDNSTQLNTKKYDGGMIANAYLRLQCTYRTD